MQASPLRRLTFLMMGLPLLRKSALQGRNTQGTSNRLLVMAGTVLQEKVSAAP
jgi:hypothetical protein